MTSLETAPGLAEDLQRLRESVRVVVGGETRAELPPLSPADLGDPDFCRSLGLQHPYLAGAMANGIASTDIVNAMGSAGMLGFFGAAGLPTAEVERAIDRIRPGIPSGFNLIHSPNEPALESGAVDLYIRRGVRLVEASAFLDLTPHIVRYRVHGLTTDGDGRVVPAHRVVAKVSRVEVAQKFLSPPPDAILDRLLAEGKITADERALAPRLAVADALTAEADSGGHTDNRPAIALLPTMLDLARRLAGEQGLDRPLPVGLAGGIATPHSVAAAFAMGAAYVVTGSINQACVESGTCDEVRRMLAGAGPADVMMAPAADMFEMGVKLQVLKRGTMFGMRATRLYELYRAHDAWHEVPAADRTKVETTFFRATFDEIWERTRGFFNERDPVQVERAEGNAKYKMALVFRWYLGLSSHWANSGQDDRKIDYQVWCGPAMGAFNEWAAGSCLEAPENRRVATVARNLLHGACVMARLSALRVLGIRIPHVDIRPIEPERLEHLL